MVEEPIKLHHIKEREIKQAWMWVTLMHLEGMSRMDTVDFLVKNHPESRITLMNIRRRNDV